MESLSFITFLFGTIEGVWVLMGIVLVGTLILAFVAERNLKHRYVDRGFKNPEDDWNNPHYGDEDWDWENNRKYEDA